MARPDAEQIKRVLGLQPLELEGGFYRQTYESAERLDANAFGARYNASRSLSTAIYYLLTTETFSALHRLASDEVYHFYLGDPVELLMLDPTDGNGRKVMLGTELLAGQRPQLNVPRGLWQGSRLQAGGEYALLGTTMSPGFDYTDFELGRRADLSAQFGEWADMIAALTRD